jgi:hypothetical protein
MVEPWAQTWSYSDGATTVERPLPPLDDFPPSGHACAGCPGVSRPACCQHVARVMELRTATRPARVCLRWPWRLAPRVFLHGDYELVDEAGEKEER